MQRTRILALLALLAVASLPGLTAAAGVDVTIGDVRVTPEQPVPGDEITVETTIENLGSSDAAYFVDRVALLEADDGPDEYADVKDIGTVSVGDSKVVPLTTAFDEEGTYDVRVKVWGRSTATDQRTVVQYPVTVRVRDRHPQLDLDANDTAVGVAGTGSVTVANSLGSPIDDVELRIDGETVEITNRREVLASVAAGDSRTVGFEYRPESRGDHRLNATLSYTTAGGTTDSISETVTVSAERVRPQLDVAVDDSVAGVESNGTVTVANGVGAAIENVELTVEGRDLTVRNDREVFTSVANGDAVTTTFDVRAAAPGEQTLNATLAYSTGGQRRTVSERVVVDVDPLRDRVSLDVSAVQRSDSAAVVVDVFNQGNAAVTNVSLRGTAPNATVQRALVERVPPGESTTVRLNATLSADRAVVDVAATYDVGERAGEATGSTSLRQTPGTIDLTGVQVIPQGGRLRITGSASNLGTTTAESVLVSVAGTDRVTPVAPNPEYFVGVVPASDFVSFDVYASTRGNVSTVPLEVSYLVDGERRTDTVEVDAAAASRAMAVERGPPERAGGGPGIVGFAVGAVVVLGVLGGVTYAWRKRRGGD